MRFSSLVSHAGDFGQRAEAAIFLPATLVSCWSNWEGVPVQSSMPWAFSSNTVPTRAVP